MIWQLESSMATNSTLKYERVDRQSAQVISNITDLSRITETVPGYASVAVITAPKGPTDVAVLLRSTDDLVNTFGNPTGDHIQLLCVYGMLQRGKACWVVRVADPFYAANSKALLSKDKLLNPVDGTNNKYVDNGFTNLSDKTNKFVASDMGAFKGLGAYNLNPDHPIDNVTIPELVKTIPGNDSELAKVVLYGVIDEKVDITDDGTVRSFSIPATTHVVVENVGAEKLEVGKVKLSVAVGREDSEDSATVIDGVGILDYVLNASDVVEVEETEDGPDKMLFKCVPVGSGESVSYNLELDIGFIAPGLELSETPEIPSDYAEKGILDIDQDEWTWNVHTSVSVNDGSPVVSSVKYMAVYETGTGSDKKTFMSMFPAIARMEAKTSGSELNGSNIHFEYVTKDQARILNESVTTSERSSSPIRTSTRQADMCRSTRNPLVSSRMYSARKTPIHPACSLLLGTTDPPTTPCSSSGTATTETLPDSRVPSWRSSPRPSMPRVKPCMSPSDRRLL